MNAERWELMAVVLFVLGAWSIYAPAGVLVAGVYCLLLAGQGGTDDDEDEDTTGEGGA